MKISKNNNFIKMYQAMYPDNDLPRSICPLFWKVLIGVVLTAISPLMLIYGIIRKLMGKNFYSYNKYEDSQLWGYMFLDKMLLIVWLVIALLWAPEINGVAHLQWYHFILGPLSAIIVISSFILIIWVAISFVEWLKKRSYTTYEQKVENPSVIKEALKGLWNKVCPLIEYEN